MDPKMGRKRASPEPKGGAVPPPKTVRTPTASTPSPNLLIPVAIALLIVLLTIVYLWRRKGRKGRSVLVVGPCDSGKTALFSRIVGGPVVQTVTSLVPNELEYVPKNGKPALVVRDLPGHDRVQIKFWDGNKAGARGIICVVDASAGNKGIRDAADVLYRVLTDSSVASVCPSILIFANKQDQPMSKGTKVIRNQLEKELTTLRLTKSASLSSTGGKDSSSRVLGSMEKDFDFDQMTHLEIHFGEGSALGDKGSLAMVYEWLDSIA